MCGRFHFGILPDDEGKKIKERIEKLNLKYKEGEIFPTDKVLCIVPTETDIDFASLKWGIESKSLLINARIETLNEKITYKSIINNRCAIICNGFYEWDEKKYKYYIDFKEKYMYLACIFNKNNELVIITKEADNDFNKIHNRIPIIMNKEEMIDYLHNGLKDYSKKKLNIKAINEEIKLF